MEPSKYKRRSLLWNYFTIVDSRVASCDVCKQQLSYKASSSNLRKHLQRKHPAMDPLAFEQSESSSNAVKSQSDPLVEIMENLETPEVQDTHPTSINGSPSKSSTGNERKKDPSAEVLGNRTAIEVHCVRTPNHSSQSIKKSSGFQKMDIKRSSDEHMERSRRADINEYEAVGVSVAAKLQRMDPTQAVFAESLISQILCKGLLKTLTSTNLNELNE